MYHAHFRPIGDLGIRIIAKFFDHWRNFGRSKSDQCERHVFPDFRILILRRPHQTLQGGRRVEVTQRGRRGRANFVGRVVVQHCFQHGRGLFPEGTAVLVTELAEQKCGFVPDIYPLVAGQLDAALERRPLPPFLQRRGGSMARYLVLVAEQV